MLPDLPVTAALPTLLSSLVAGRNAVVVAPPGAGKTTLVPLALLDAPWRGDSAILMLEPRRLATRAAAARMSFLLGSQVGGTVGYRTRLDAATSPATRIEVVTEGLLIRRLQSDPGLDGVAVVILDEVHERSVEADLALALCRDLQRVLRPELRLIAMSATLDGERLASLLDADVIESAGQSFPLTIRHAVKDISAPRDLPDAMARALRTALAEYEGDILAFLPGMSEIRRTQTALDGCGAAVLPLHGDLPPAEQDLALRVADGRRVVLATSIAETSLTVPGVRIVVDSGWRRAPRLDPSTGLTRLTTVRISRAAADQRAGRACREGSGIAIRLWTAALHRGLAAYDRPEILEAELSALALDCAAWGSVPSDLPFPDPPPAGPLAAGKALLTELGALDTQGRITPTGRRMAALGGHPRLAAMMLAAETPGEAALAADLAALLEERDPLRGPETPADIGLRLAALNDGSPMADRGALGRIRRVASQYRQRLHTNAIAAGDPGKLLAAAFPDRIAQRRSDPGSFRLAGGGGARLPRADPLATAPLLAVASLDLKATARIRLAARLDPETLTAGRITEQVETSIDPASGAVMARRRRRWGSLILSDRTETVDPGRVAALLAAAVAAERLLPLPWTERARQLQARVAIMARVEPGIWPDLSDETLAATAEQWLAPHMAGMTRLRDISQLDVANILRALLSWELTRRLDEALPATLALCGVCAAIDYTQPVPVAAARAQAFYGVTSVPKLADGRVTLQLSLLSPAGRPIARTADLAGFWRRGWPEVRREMRGRYPKHAWPEDPSSV